MNTYRKFYKIFLRIIIMVKIFNYDGDSFVSPSDRMLARNIYNRQRNPNVSYNTKSIDEKIDLTYSALRKLRKLPLLGSFGRTEKRVVETYGDTGLEFLKKVQRYVKDNGVDKAYTDLNSVLRRDIAFQIDEIRYREKLLSAS
jgi:hypothetical protein